MANSTQYKRLFEPVRIGQMQLKNRIVMPPMGTGFAEQGHVSQRQLDYYEARARGGAGLIIIEVTAPDLQCHGSPGQLTLGDDRVIPSFQRLADTVHKHGARIAVQLQHSSWEIREGKPVQVISIRNNGTATGGGGFRADPSRTYQRRNRGDGAVVRQRSETSQGGRS